MGTFYWMGLSDGNSRSVPEFNQADLKEALVKGYYGEEGFSGIGATLNDKEKVTNNKVVYDLQGRKISELKNACHTSTFRLKKGLNIVRTSNGYKTIFIPFGHIFYQNNAKTAQ